MTSGFANVFRWEIFMQKILADLDALGLGSDNVGVVTVLSICAIPGLLAPDFGERRK